MQNVLLKCKEPCKYKVPQHKTGLIVSLQIYDVNIQLLRLNSQNKDTIPSHCYKD